MTKAVLENVDEEIKHRRRQVAQMHEDLEDLEDYLDVLEARRRSLGKKPTPKPKWKNDMPR